MRTTNLMLAAGAALMLFMATLLVGVAYAADARHDYVIPAGKLDTALNALATQAHIQVLYAPELVSGKSSAALSGNYSVDEALARLLKGTGLRGQSVNENTWAIRTAQVPTTTNVQSKEEPVQLNTIVVSAARTGERSLLDTPLAISAFDGNWLENNGFQGMNDFIQLAPGVSMVQLRPGENRIQMRGVSANIGENAVGYYLDEVPMSFINQVGLPDIRAFDMDRVEILRGPQGTLYGAGALGGVVRSITRAPSLDEYQLKTDFSISSTDGAGANYSANVAANAPLVNDKIGFRAVLTREDNSGWIDHPAINKPNYNSNDLTAGRVELLAKVNDQFTISGLYWHSKSSMFASPKAFRDMTSDERSATPADTGYNIYNVTLDYDAPTFHLVSSTSHMVMDLNSRADFALGYALNTTLNPRAWAQEVRAYSTGSSPWQWSGGVFYRWVDQTQIQDSPLMPILGIDPVEQYDKVISKSAFGELTRRMLEDRLELTIGARVLEETRSSLQLYPVPTDPYGKTFHAVTPRVSLAYHPARNWMIYGDYSQGYRSGTNQFATVRETAAVLGVSLPSTVEPERADSYELGVKGSFFDKHLTIDADVFTLKWHNMQATVPIVQNQLYATLNAAGASSSGVEFAVRVQAAPGLQLGMTGSWVDATIDADVIAHAQVLDPVTGQPSGASVPIIVYNKGDRISDVPRSTAGLTLDYTRPLSRGGLNLVAHASAQYAAAREQVSFTSVTTGDPVTIADGRVGLESLRWGVYLFGSNLFNSKALITPSKANGYGPRPQPRTFGVNFKCQF